MPPQAVRPSGSKEAGKIALETAFQQSSEKLSLSGSQLTVQSLQLSLPADAEVTGLTFVMRSKDESAWFRDGWCRQCTANNCIFPPNFSDVALVLRAWP